MGEFRDTLQKRYMAQDNTEADSKFRANGSGLTTVLDASDVPDALRNTREVLDLVVACMVALLLIVLVVTVIVTIVTRLVDLFKQRKQMKLNIGSWRSDNSGHPVSQRLATSPLLPLASPKSAPLPPSGPYRAIVRKPTGTSANAQKPSDHRASVPKPSDHQAITSKRIPEFPPNMLPPSAPPAEHRA